MALTRWPGQITGNACAIRFNSDGSSGQQESAAKRDHHKSRPVRFDAEAATRSFRLQRVTPGAKPPSTAESASPDGLKRHLEHAAENKEHTKPYEGHARLLYPRTPRGCCAENPWSIQRLSAALRIRPTLKAAGRTSAPHRLGITLSEDQATYKHPA